MVDAGEGYLRGGDCGGAGARGTEAREEGSRVRSSGNESVSGIAVCANDGGSNGAMLCILRHLGRLDGDSTLLNSLVINPLYVVDLECHILNSIAVLLQMLVNLFQKLPVFWGDGLVLWEVLLRPQRRCEDESNVSVGNDVGREVSRAGLKTAIGECLEAEECGVVRSGLLRVAYVPGDVIITCKVGGWLNSIAVGR